MNKEKSSRIANLRYQIIDACLTNKQRPYPSMQNLIDTCKRKLDADFKISTIQKDIKALKDGEALLGIEAPIKYSKQYEGYYYADSDFSIKKILLQPNEIAALKASADLLTMYTGSRISESYNKAVENILAAIHEQFPSGDKNIKIVQTDYSCNHKGFEHFELFLQAAKEKLPVSIVHYSYEHRAFKSVIIHPAILKEFQNSWYIVGYSEFHKEIRTFGLDRVYEPILLNHTFKDQSSQSRMDFFKNIYGVYPLKDEKLQEIEIMVDPLLSDYIHAHPIHVSQERKKQASHGHAIFTVKLIPSYELIKLFSSHSNQLVVTKPLWMQKEITKKHKEAISYEEKHKY